MGPRLRRHLHEDVTQVLGSKRNVASRSRLNPFQWDARGMHPLECPACGSRKVTTVRLPRPHGPTEPPTTQRGFRCLRCDAQWVDETQWQSIRDQS